MNEPAHAVYAPSSASRWLLCTASAEGIAAMERVIGPREEGEEAADGTAAHEEIDRVLGPCAGGEIEDGYPRPAPNPINSHHVAAYGIALVIDFVRQLVTATPGKLWIEQRVRLTDEIWGRCDVAHWDAESSTLTVLDYKNGFVDVQAERNAQCRIYAAATITTHQLPARWVRYVVVQPNSFIPGPRVKQWVESAEDLYVFAQQAAAVPHGPKEFKAGGQCTYCPLFGQCPASKDMLRDLSVLMADRADQVSPLVAARVKACEKPIADWFTAFNKTQLALALKAGAPPPGMKLIETSPHRAWKNPVEARSEIAERFGLPAFDPPTPAQAEKLGMSKEDVEKLAVRPPGGPALALASSTRKEWKPKTGLDMFGAVLQQVPE